MMCWRHLLENRDDDQIRELEAALQFPGAMEAQRLADVERAKAEKDARIARAAKMGITVVK